MKKILFEVQAWYPLSHWYTIDSITWESKLDRIAKKYGGQEYGTGAGFGHRDLHYGGFKEESKAKAFASRLKRFKVIKSAKVSQEEEY